MSDRRSRLEGYGLALLAAACWAVGGLTAKWLFTDASAPTAAWPYAPLGIRMDPAVLAAGRAILSFVMLAAYLVIASRDRLRVRAVDVPFLAVFGVVGLGGMHYAYFKAISLTGVATAILLEYLAPVIVLIVSVAFLRHRLTWSLPAGVLLSVTGCALVVGALAPGGMVVSGAGVVWGLAAAALFATYTLMGVRIARRMESLTALVYGLGFASAFWLIAMGPTTILHTFSQPGALLALAFMAVVSTIVPFAAFLAALRRIPATNASVTSTVEPVFAGLGAFVLFGETLLASQLLGGALVLLAIAVVQFSDRYSAPVMHPQE